MMTPVIRRAPVDRGTRLLLPLCASVGMWGQAAAAGAAIFTGHVESYCVTTMMIRMLLSAMVWEFVTARVEKKLKKNPAHFEMLTKVYKELMILGFIGFMLVMTKEYGYTLSPATMHCFEFCDLMVTICVLLYIGCTAISSFFNHVTRRNWDRIALSTVDAVCIEFEEHLEQIENNQCTRMMSLWSSNWRARADFKLVELLFKTKFHLEKNFDYMMYAKTVLEDNVVDLANISTWHWAAICAISLAIYFAGPGDPDKFLAAFEFIDEIPGISTNSSAVDEDDGHRRLAASAEPACVEPALPCGLNATALQLAVNDLFLRPHNSTNASKYNETCGECTASTQHVWHLDRPVIKDAIVYYGALAWSLTVVQALINRWLTHKMNLIVKYHGAHKLSVLPKLLRKLDEHFNETERDQSDKDLEQMIEINEDSEGSRTNEDDEHHMMIFADGKDANDILSWWMFRFLMFTSKLIQLIMCFYMGFYVCHMNLRLQLVSWRYLEAFGIYDDQTPDRDNPGSSSLYPRYGVHLWLIFPILWVVFRQLPNFTRQISLLVGVLHLHEEAVNKVTQHMEVVKSIRKRIRERLQKTKILKGKKKIKKGMKQLQLVENGEFEILSKLKLKDDADVGNETRLTRKEIQALLDQYKTETADRELAAFMDRDAFNAYTKLSPWNQQTAQTAKTLIIADRGRPASADSITLRELVTFLVRAIADSTNIADEHGVDSAQITQIQKKVIELSTVTSDDFEEARLLARTKSLFRQVDSDRSGHVTRAELHRAFRKYRVPMSSSDMDTIMRVMDPDQSGQITMDEWLDFMLSSDDELEHQSLEATEVESKMNAEAGGETIMSSWTKYGEEAIEALPGGIYVTHTIKDPLGTVNRVGERTLQVVKDPIHAIEEDLLPVLGVPEQRKPVQGNWDPEGNTANTRSGQPLSYEIDDDRDDDEQLDTMDNPLSAAQPEVVSRRQSFEQEDPRTPGR